MKTKEKTFISKGFLHNTYQQNKYYTKEGDNFYLAGGSEETHDRMTETVIKFNEKLSRRGKTINDLSRDEFNDLMHEVSGK